MRKPLVAALFALVIAGAGAAPAVAAPAPGAPAATASAAEADTRTAASPTLQAVTLAGTVALSNCSGSVVRFPNSLDTAPALVLTNGHCLESGFPEPGEVIVNRVSTRTFGLLNSMRHPRRDPAGQQDRLLDDDRHGRHDLPAHQHLRGDPELVRHQRADRAGHAPHGFYTAITVASGYWKRLYSCSIDGFVHTMKEGDWTWKDSVRYTSACDTIGGTSGSPVVDQATGKVVAVNNTGNEDGERCTVNNPCEVDASGNVTVRQGINYAQETYQFPACFTTGNQLSLSASGCVLPKP